MMSDDKMTPKPQDTQKVNLKNEEEVPYWTSLFGCTRQDLEKAVEKVGVVAVDVERELQTMPKSF